MSKIRTFIDYPVSETKEFKGLSFPQVLYDYLKKRSEFEIVGENDPIDLMFIFSAGSQYAHLDIDPYPIPNIVSKFKNIIYKRIYGVEKIDYERFMRHNIYYENRVKRLKEKNKSMKIILRLDDKYRLLCKLYGYDDTVAWLISLADKVIYQTEYNKSLYTKDTQSIFGVEKALKINNGTVIYNGVDTSVFNSNGEKFELDGKYKILHVAATGMVRKGLGTVLEFANLLKNNNDFQFYLIGRQTDDPIYGKDIHKFKNVHYLGFTDNRFELAKYYRSCDILLFPSINDCSPNVVLEAMSCGLPVIASNSGGTPELIAKDNIQGGLLISENNQLYALKEMVNNLTEFKSNAIEIVDKYFKEEIMGRNYAAEALQLFNIK